MSETFYGTWLIDVVSKDAAYSQRYIVSGSDRVDGVYPGDVSSPRLQISGAEWTLTLEWNDNVNSGWQPSRVIRRTTTFDVDDGLVVVLGIDDNWPTYADNDYDDLVIRCQNIDPQLLPWYPHRQTVDFRLPRGKGRGGGKPGDGLNDPCKPCSPPREGTPGGEPIMGSHLSPIGVRG
ncbi:hypothetical protein [Variovorax sp. YR752]|uniref:hypothetical protein n=1 Tax=Variovorax sp. YR752 TaxID=1884383 RepID=UPI0031381A99